MAYSPYSRCSTFSAPYLTRSLKHLIWIESTILLFDSGVDMWKSTPSKSETVWSIVTGGALWFRSGISLAILILGGQGQG